MKTAVADDNILTFSIDTDTGSHIIEVDLAADLGELSPGEFVLLNSYVQESGFLPDHERAMAGGHIFIKLLRAAHIKGLDVNGKDLLAAVVAR